MERLTTRCAGHAVMAWEHEEQHTTQIITKDNKVYCTTTVPYPPQVIKQMKAAGYKVKEVEKK